MFSRLKISSYFLNHITSPRLVVDTDILSDIAKEGESKAIEKHLLDAGITLVFVLPSIMELGFGPDNKADPREIEYYKGLYHGKSSINSNVFACQSQEILNSKDVRGKWIGISPDSHNWFAAKMSLVNYMNAGKTPKNAKEYQFDSLLNAVSWNINAFVWTNDLDDHVKVNYFMLKNLSRRNAEGFARRISPVLNNIILKEVISGNKINIYQEMQKYVSSEEELKILELASKLGDAR